MLKKLKRKIKPSLTPGFIVPAIGVVLITFGGAHFIIRYYALHKNLAAAELSKTVVFSKDRPSEGPVANDNPYNVAPNHPKKIRIPKIGVDGLIQKVSTDQYNNVATPINVRVAGWFVNGSIPGQPGLSIMDGHVSGVYSSGIFKNLNKLKSKDEFTIEFGDGSKKKFQVTTIKEVSLEDARRFIFQRDKSVPSQLNLITCSGTFDKQSHSYKNRIIIYSKPL